MPQNLRCFLFCGHLGKQHRHPMHLMFVKKIETKLLNTCADCTVCLHKFCRSFLCLLTIFLPRTDQFSKSPERPILFRATLLSAIEELLRGFPIIDFFIQPPDESNINIFRSNAAFCRFIVLIQGQSCGGLAAGSYSFDNGPPLVLCPICDAP